MQWQAVLFYKQRISCITRETKYLIQIPGAVIVQNIPIFYTLYKKNAVVLISGFVVHMIFKSVLFIITVYEGRFSSIIKTECMSYHI